MERLASHGGWNALDARADGLRLGAVPGGGGVGRSPHDSARAEGGGRGGGGRGASVRQVIGVGCEAVACKHLAPSTWHLAPSSHAQNNSPPQRRLSAEVQDRIAGGRDRHFIDRRHYWRLENQ